MSDLPERQCAVQLVGAYELVFNESKEVFRPGGAVEGIRAVENRLIAGKIVLYPACRGLELIWLEEMKSKLPRIAEQLRDGLWNKKAEHALLQMYSGS